MAGVRMGDRHCDGSFFGFPMESDALAKTRVGAVGSRNKEKPFCREIGCLFYRTAGKRGRDPSAIIPDV